MTDNIAKYVPFCINVQGVSEDTQLKIYRFLSEHFNSDYNESEGCIGGWIYMGVTENCDGDRFVYFSDESECYSVTKEVTEFTMEEFEKIMKNQSIEQKIETDVMMKILNNLKDGLTIYHFRNQDVNGKVTSNGGKTVVFYELDSGEMLMGIAVCSKEDNFDRKKGIELAKIRFREVQEKSTGVPAKFQVSEFIEEFGNDEEKRLFNLK